jgi:hypothetical protein
MGGQVYYPQNNGFALITPNYTRWDVAGETRDAGVAVYYRFIVLCFAADYWLVVLHKRLLGTGVLAVTSSSPDTDPALVSTTASVFAR